MIEVLGGELRHKAAELEAAPQDDLPRPGSVLALRPDDLDALFTAGQSDVFEVDRLSGRLLFVRFVSDHEGDGGLVSGDNARNVGTEDAEISQFAIRKPVEFTAGTVVGAVLLH